MRLDFIVEGKNCLKANVKNTFLDYFSFEDKDGNEYCIDSLLGEVDFDFQKEKIIGSFKGDYEITYPKIDLSTEELIDKIINMNKSSFELGLFIEPEEDDNYSSVKARIQIDDKILEIE